MSGTWGNALEVPGTDALNQGGRAEVASVSCASAGNCSAGGEYASGTAGGKPVNQAFGVTQSGGHWGTAVELPGTATLNAGGRASIVSVSCRAPGNCGAGGYYTDASGITQAFVVNETGGTWGTAEEVPGFAALDLGPAGGQVTSVSCAAVGDCSAGGYYASASIAGIPTVQAVVVTETGGHWGTAQEVPRTATLNTGGYAQITSVSCTAAGVCSAGGEYTTSAAATEAFVVSQTGGTWGRAHEVRGIATLNSNGLAVVNSVSCSSAGNCSAVGPYEGANFDSQAFVVTETGGTWGVAQEVPGTAALDQGSPGATAASVSCGAVGDCSLGGSYSDSSGRLQAFVASETGGTWGTAQEVPGMAALNAGGAASIDTMSCPSAGNCGAGGHYTKSATTQQAFVVSETGA